MDLFPAHLDRNSETYNHMLPMFPILNFGPYFCILGPVGPTWEDADEKEQRRADASAPVKLQANVETKAVGCGQGC